VIILIDDRIVNDLKTKFSIPLASMIYSQLEVAKTHWIRINNGVMKLPFIAFYRRVQFAELFKVAHTTQVTGFPSPNIEQEVKFTWVDLAYTVEIVHESIVDQVAYFRDYIFWANEAPIIQITDLDGNKWKFKVRFEDPEDNSDLESEEELGRVVRTTLNFTVEAILLDRSIISQGLITKALASIHLYDGQIDAFTEKVADLSAVAPA